MTLVPRGNFFDIDHVFDNFWSPAKHSETPESGFFALRVDIKELDNCYEITAELPGVKKDGIHVTLEDGVLSISADFTDGVLKLKAPKAPDEVPQKRRIAIDG